jgi:hypothetical protein
MTPRDMWKLSAETGVHPKTVRRWLDGEQTEAATDYALRAAAERLGIEVPERQAAEG